MASPLPSPLSGPHDCCGSGSDLWTRVLDVNKFLGSSDHRDFFCECVWGHLGFLGWALMGRCFGPFWLCLRGVLGDVGAFFGATWGLWVVPSGIPRDQPGGTKDLRNDTCILLKFAYLGMRSHQGRTSWRRVGQSWPKT